MDDVKDFQVAVYPNQNEIMGDAFAQIGTGMGALGQAMGQGFSALGKGMGTMGAATGEIGMQAGMINGIQQIQGQMYTLKYDTLPQLKAAASSMPTGTPQYAQRCRRRSTRSRRGAARHAVRGRLACRSRSPARRSKLKAQAKSASSGGDVDVERRELIGLLEAAARPRWRSASCASATSRRSPTRRSTAAWAAARTAARPRSSTS